MITKYYSVMPVNSFPLGRAGGEAISHLMNKYAIIVAGGKGLRMGGDLPKQFIPIEGCPVLMHTLDTFHACDESIQIILVLPRDHQDYWHELCAQYQFAMGGSEQAGGLCYGAWGELFRRLTGLSSGTMRESYGRGSCQTSPQQLFHCDEALQFQQFQQGELHTHVQEIIRVFPDRLH